MWFDLDFLDFQIKLCHIYFGNFLASRLFGLLFEKIVDFFTSTGHPGTLVGEVLQLRGKV